MSSPTDEYRRRLQIREERLEQARRLQGRFGTARLALAALGAVLAWLSLHDRRFAAPWLLLPLATFVALVSWHGLIRRRERRAARAATFYRRGLDRLAGQWAGCGEPGDRFNDLHHVYAADLDLFGRGSLFELLCTARTRMGEERLAGWLKTAAPVAEVRERQRATAELAARIDLREALACTGERPEVGIHPQALPRWAQAARELPAHFPRALPLALAVLAIAGAVLWGVWDLRAPLLAVLLIEVIVFAGLRGPLHRVLAGTEEALEDLPLFVEILRQIEAERFDAPLLEGLRAQLAGGSVRASQALSQLATIAACAEARENPILRVLDVPLMYSLQVGLAAERWRAAHGREVNEWIEATGRFEALCCLAGYAFENPQDAFPLVSESAARFCAAQLGHPLLPRAHCVRNDVVIEEPVRVLIVSGSNMSGKSTLLRAVGINAVLARTGAPVCAQRLEMSALEVGASIRVNDSLQEGTSRFYAEILRLRQLYELAAGRQLLFLLDELLQGTNSRDRRIGTQGILSGFLERGAIGLVSTHDLALTEVRGTHEGCVHNVHFQEELDAGRMRFDFKLREGVVATSNGLELMRSIGLKV